MQLTPNARLSALPLNACRAPDAADERLPARADEDERSPARADDDERVPPRFANWLPTSTTQSFFDPQIARRNGARKEGGR